MPTYEYECDECGLHFEQWQSISEKPLGECPHCGGQVRRLISGGIGFIMGGNKYRVDQPKKNDCSLESSGKTCCGRNERCDSPRCEEK
jgi:putative FmdB family regulatory protein